MVRRRANLMRPIDADLLAELISELQQTINVGSAGYFPKKLLASPAPF